MEKERITFRLVCHVSRIGGLIGPNGSIVKNLQKQSDSKIWVENPPRNSSTGNCVINVMGSPFLSRKINIPTFTQVYGRENHWVDVSTAQEGLFRVFERVVVVAAEGKWEDDGIVACRVLAGKSQVGAVIGKKGVVVDRIRKETGCKVSVLVDDKECSWQFPSEEIVEIEGDLLGVKKALIAVTGRLQEFPPSTIEPTRRHSPGLQPISSNSFTDSFNNGYKELDYESIPRPDFTKRQQEVDFTKQQVVFMILCPAYLVSSVIGRGGSIIKTIHRKSGATINIEPAFVDCGERLINIYAMENLESQYSNVRNAAVLLFNRIMESSFEKKSDLDWIEPEVEARVVVPSNQVGCLLGKGGTIISEMRKATSTGLRFLRGDQVPKCLSENVEILEITGEFENVRDAICMVVDKLREHISFLQSSIGSSNRDPLTTDNCNHNKPLAPGMHRAIATSSNGVELGRSAIVTNTTVEVVVAENLISSIVGENGSNLNQMREISCAKVTVHGPQLGTTNRTIVISGSPIEVQAAQSLLQAFILSGSP